LAPNSHGLAPFKELVEAKEESEELGGYFIVNGIEKLIRMLIVQRRNHPMAKKAETKSRVYDVQKVVS
jgi:DNA-directed RNA polymerase beta subunit